MPTPTPPDTEASLQLRRTALPPGRCPLAAVPCPLALVQVGAGRMVGGESRMQMEAPRHSCFTLPLPGAPAIPPALPTCAAGSWNQE